MAAANLAYLARVLGDDEYRKRANRTIAAFQSLMDASPTLFPGMAITVAELAGGEEGAEAEVTP